MNFDPRTKMFSLVIISSIAVFCPDIYFLCGVLAVCILCGIVYNVRFLNLLKRVWGLLPTAVFIGVFQWLVTKNYYYGIEFLLRMSIIVFAAAFLSTNDVSENIAALIKLKVPYEIAFMTGIAVRFIPVFKEEFIDRLNAIKLRGIDLKHLSIGKKLRIYSYIIGPVVYGCIYKSKEMSASALTRGFRAHKTRTAYKKFKFSAADYIFNVFNLGIIAAFIVLRIML